MNMTRDEWRTALGLRPDEHPTAVVLEGTWWEARATAARTRLLDDVRALDFPGLHFARYRGVPLVYACAYGAPRAVEAVHALACVGARLAIQIGSCGALQDGVRTGDVVVPERAVIGEGASAYYGGFGLSIASPRQAAAAEAELVRAGMRVHRGLHLTTSALFMQPPATIDRWHRAGYLAVDMETSAVYAAAAHFQIDAVALLFAWDELLRGRSFLAPFSAAERARQETANEATFHAALALIGAAP
jgi:uridine phosphorylase